MHQVRQFHPWHVRVGSALVRARFTREGCVMSLPRPSPHSQLACSRNLLSIYLDLLKKKYRQGLLASELLEETNVISLKLHCSPKKKERKQAH